MTTLCSCITAARPSLDGDPTLLAAPIPPPPATAHTSTVTESLPLGVEHIRRTGARVEGEGRWFIALSSIAQHAAAGCRRRPLSLGGHHGS